jgi:putative ABC transport system permease protein
MRLRLLTWSLRHRRARHFANAITIAITATVVIVFASMVASIVTFVRSSVERDIRRILLQPKMGDFLPLAAYPQLQKVDGAQSVVRARIFGGRHPSGARYLIVGEEEPGIDMMRDIFPVEPAVFEAWKADRPTGAIITEDIARDLHVRIGDSVELPTSLGPLTMKIDGLSRGGTVQHRIVVHFEYVRDFANASGECTYRVAAKPPDVERVVRAIDDLFANSPTPVWAMSADSARAAAVRDDYTLPAIVGFLGAFLILTTALTLGNTVAIAIRERRMELATMRVLGFYRSTIAGLMLSETIVVGLFGGLLGVGASVLLFRHGLPLPGGSSLQINPTLGIAPIAAGILVSILVPIAGALPAVLASVRTPLVDALRDDA